MTTFALEKLLEEIWKEDPSVFPDHNCNYYVRYGNALNKLHPMYKQINPSMALSSSPHGLYTDHGLDHFDEVVNFLGDLIPSRLVNKDGCVKPYELFVILMAARIHDVGNIGSRKDHEKYCFDTLEKICDGNDKIERALIASVAQAHGGKSVRGCQDTIGDIVPNAGTNTKTLDARKCAALVRIADEFCENRGRAFPNVDFSKEALRENEIYHAYASCISANHFSDVDRYLTIVIDVPIEFLNKKYPTHPRPDGILIVEEIANRLQKLDLERKYCNNYLPPELRIRGIKVTIRVYRQECSEDGRAMPIKQVVITEHFFEDTGYPKPSHELTDLWPDLMPDKFNSLVENQFLPPKTTRQGKLGAWCKKLLPRKNT